MFISTKGRYAVRILIDLAEQFNLGEKGYIPMKEVAARQEISLKYVGSIMPLLKNANLVAGMHGVGGGYRLVKPPEQYNLWEILQAAEGKLAPVSCLLNDTVLCKRIKNCKTLPIWKKYYKVTQEFFSNILLSDVVEKTLKFN